MLRPDGLYHSQQRFGMYRWHLPDPVRFSTDLRVTIQALGWRSGGRYLPLHDEIASTALWYQRHPEGLADPVRFADLMATRTDDEVRLVMRDNAERLFAATA